MASEISLANAVDTANTGLDAIKRAPIVEEDTGIKCLRIQDVSQDKSFNDWGFTEVTPDNFRKFQLKQDDIMIARTGGSVGVNRFIFDDVQSVFNNGLIRIRSKTEEFYPKYIYYLLQTDSFKSHINSIAYSTSAQPNMKIRDLLRFSFLYQDLSKQKAIAHILGSLDDKIELNLQMNETLEAMAQALFKSWFVDFDPVIDNALATGNAIPDEFSERAEQRKSIEKKDNSEIQGLFPDGFELTEEMGWIPKGWVVESFGDVSICFDRLRIPLSKRERESKQPGGIPYHGATSVMDYINEWIFDDIYLLIGEDGSVIKEDGSPFVQYIWGKTWVNNHAHVLQGKDNVSTEHLMLFMQSQNLAAYITGAVQLKINQGNMNRIPFLNAGNEINREFAVTIKPFYEKLRNTIEANQILIKLRDTLLPKLMSGELRISDAAALVEEI